MIRSLEEKDIDAIVELEKECFNDAWSREAILRDVETNDLARHFVLEKEGKIIGYIFFWITFDSATIINLAVEKEERKKGYGQRLLEACIEACEAEGCEFLTLEVRASNKAAQSLYKKNGFMCVNIKKGYYTDNYEDALYMVKPLMIGEL